MRAANCGIRQAAPAIRTAINVLVVGWGVPACTVYNQVDRVPFPVPTTGNVMQPCKCGGFIKNSGAAVSVEYRSPALCVRGYTLQVCALSAPLAAFCAGLGVYRPVNTGQAAGWRHCAGWCWTVRASCLCIDPERGLMAARPPAGRRRQAASCIIQQRAVSH